MARKLTPEELERNKADFDIPAGMEPLKPEKKKAAPVPKKGKTSAAKTGTKKPAPKKEQKKEENKKPTPPPAPPVAPAFKRGGGRPGAFEKVQILTVKLPPEDVVKLKVKAAEQGKTVAQVIHDWLN